MIGNRRKPRNCAQLEKGKIAMKYRRHDSDRKPTDKRTRRAVLSQGKRAFLNSCL
ncbi:hypothetical protein [Bradyrhizobium sp. C9]|uniref:hypothetical protein n=1 Tax=Bradyrhizobium sp. C9 TaxID=142585 RepID=UPI0013045973|nr:hypothetical protein [Bradyrhizobium sp. C9]